MTGGRDVVVFGGGALGGAIARLAATEGNRVVVASREPRPHPGLWRRLDLDGRGRLVEPGARVFIALGPGPKDDPVALNGRVIPEAVARAWREGAESVTICVAGGSPPLPSGASGHRATVLHLAPLLATDDRCVGPLVRVTRAGGVARLPRDLTAVWPLAVEDAARAASRLAGSGTAKVVSGRDRATLADVATALIARYGGRIGAAWFGGLDAPRRAALAAAAELPDEWDDTALGTRMTIAEWVERLPGPRRRR